MELRNWSDIAADGWDAIVLGNGASIAVDPTFSYPSLLDAAHAEKLVSDNIKQIFDYFDTKDFELVLRRLTHASKINAALGVQDRIVSDAYAGVRRALVEAIRKVHVGYEKAQPHMEAAGDFLSQFSTVVSLNYDIFVYWAMVKWNADHGLKWFKDCFIKGRFAHHWEYLKWPHPPAERATLVFYPHGNLMLALSVLGEEQKLVSSEKGALLEALFAHWQSGDYSPLFVSEGTSEQKILAIERSPYLREVYNGVLPDLGGSIVVYGWAMAEQDEHLLRPILGGKNLQQLAVSVMPTGNITKKVRNLEERIRHSVGSKQLQITFFDATSKGCWIHA